MSVSIHEGGLLMKNRQVPHSIATSILSGTKWYVGMRWCVRGLTIISSAVLARLLLPEDFGLVAVAMVILGLVALIFDFGVTWALIQNKNATKAHFDTAWTLRLLQALAVGLALYLSSPWIAAAYGDARLELVCQILSAATIVRGLENIGIVRFQIEMNFSADFRYHVSVKLISTLVTVAFALYFRNYMALVVSSVAAGLLEVLFSYIFSRYRPKVSLEKFGEIWGFSQWILARNIAKYISTQGDLVVLAGLASPTALGFYKWGVELSSMTVSEVQQPFSRALTPGLALIQDDHSRLISGYLRALSMMGLIAVPVSLGLGAVAEEVVPLFLGGGDKWLPVVPLLQALVLFAMFGALYGISGTLLTVTGHVKFTAYVYWIQAALTLLSLYPAFLLYELVGVAWARVFIGLSMFIVVSCMVIKICRVQARKILDAVWRPVIAGFSMTGALAYVSSNLNLDSAPLLLAKIFMGAIVYVLVIGLGWVVSGMPKSAEVELLSIVFRRKS